MASTEEVSIKISVDKREGETNLQAFQRSFDQFFATTLKTKASSDTFVALARSVREGQRSMDGLSASTQKLITAYNDGARVAAARDFLGLKTLDEVEKEINQVRAAFEALSRSGSVSSKELASAALIAGQRINQLKRETTGWGQALEEAKSQLLGVGAATAALGTVAKQAIQFEDKMADIAKVVEADDEQIKALGESLKEMSKTIPLSADALAELAAAGGQLGLPADKLEEFTLLAAKMATAFQMSAGEAGEAIAYMMNVFNLSVSEVAELGDAINVLGNTMATTESKIIEVMTRIGGTARQFGLAKEEAAALAASVLSLGVHAGVASTGINALLTRLQTANVQGADFKEALDRIGISANQLASDIAANPQQALMAFLRTLEKVEAASRAEILTKLFGLEYQDDIARLINGLREYDKALGNATDRQKTAGAVSREFATRIATTQAQIQLLSNNIEVLAINLGDLLLPVIKPVVSGLSDAAGALADFAKEFPAITALAGMLVTAAASAGAMRLAFLALSKVGVEAMSAMTTHMATFRLSVADASKQIGKLGVAFDAVAAGIVGWEIGSYLYDEFETVRKGGVLMIELMARAGNALQHVFESVKAAMPWSDDTLEAAEQRFLERNRSLNVIFEKMWKDAEQSKYEQRKAAQEAAQAAETAAKAAKASGEAQKKAMQAAGQAAEEARRKVEQLAEDYKTLGIDAEVFTTGITDAERKVVKAFDRMSKEAGVSAEAIMAGFTSGIEKLSQKALPDMEFALYEAFDKKLISVNQLDKGLALLAQRSKDVSVELTGVRDAAKTLGIDASVALGTMSESAAKAVRAFNDLIAAQKITKDNFETIFQAALKSADSKQAVDALTASVERLRKQFPELAPLIDKAMTALKQKADEVTPGLNSVTEAMAKLGLKSQESLKLAADSSRDVVAQLKRMGAPMEDIRQAWLKYAADAIAANKGAASSTLKAQAASMGLTKQLNDLVRANASARESVDALKFAWEKQASIAARATEAVRAQGTAMVAAAQHALEMAKIQGDTLEIEKATVAVREAEAKAAQDLAVALESEAASAWRNVAAMREKAAADGEVTLAEKELIQTATDAAKALSEQADAAANSAEKANATADQARKASSATATAAVNWGALATQYGIATDKAQMLSDAQAKIYATLANSLINAKVNDWRQYADATRYATEQAARYVHIMGEVERYAQDGDKSLGRYIRSLRAAISAGAALGREELEPLRRALEDAQERMKQLGDSARDTLNSLRDELDEMNKNYDEIERRRYEARRAEIQAQIAIAKSAGNTAAVADLQRAMTLLNKVSQERIKEAAARERDENRTNLNKGSDTAENAAVADRIVTKVVDINIKVGDDTGTAQVVEGGEEVIVDMLRKAQMVAS